MRVISEKKEKINIKGFTLVEVLVSLSVITLGGLAAFALLNQTLHSAKLSEDSIIVSNLAREGMEIVRSIRDSSANGYDSLVVGDWIVDSGSNYGITTSADDNSIVSCSNCRLYINNGRYSHVASGGVATSYKRMITIVDPSSDHVICNGGSDCERVIEVRVARDGSDAVYTLVTYLTDWR